MAITVHIPAALRGDSGGAAELVVSASTVRAALEQLERRHPALYRSVCDETGSLRRHVNLFVNDALLPRKDGFETRLEPGDVLFVIPAVSGG